MAFFIPSRAKNQLKIDFLLAEMNRRVAGSKQGSQLNPG
jgi:hypothetical protein